MSVISKRNMQLEIEYKNFLIGLYEAHGDTEKAERLRSEIKNLMNVKVSDKKKNDVKSYNKTSGKRRVLIDRELY